MTSQSADFQSPRTLHYSFLSAYIPSLNWIRHYDRDQLIGDVIAGIIVAVMLVPQGMAYALLAGLPPQMGLYASIAPLIVYGLLGSSRALSVGPMATVSLLVIAGVGQFAVPGTTEYINLVLSLTLMTAILQVAMGLLRAGFLVNFLSHPVLSGFTSAAAVIISTSQLKHVVGFNIPGYEYVTGTFWYAITHITDINTETFSIAFASFLLLLYFKSRLGNHLRRLHIPEFIIIPLVKLGPLAVVILGSATVWLFGFDVAIVGAVPMGLPTPVMPTMNIDTIQTLYPTAAAISLVGFMGSISIAKSLASKRRQKVNANQELIALGAANLAAAFTGGFPVTGGLSRSVVNFTAGARTGFASIITALLMLLTVLFLTPLFYYLPQSVLATIILIAVASLFDVKTLRETWNASRPDALALIVTFLAVLIVGIERGILVGAATSILMHLWRTSRPTIRQLGRLLGTEQYLDVDQYDVETQPDVLVLRIDESLYFPNAHHIEEYIMDAITSDRDIKSVVLVCSAVNTIDASAIHVMDALIDDMRSSGTDLYLAEVKKDVSNRLDAAGVSAKLGENHILKSTFEAYLAAKVPRKLTVN